MMSRGTTFAVALALTGCILVGQAAATTPGATNNEQLIDRLQQLESETQALRSELQRLQTQPVPLPAVEGPQISTVSALAAQDDIEYFTWDELRGEMKELAWTKGDYKIVPYGILWGTTTYETSRTRIGDYTLWAISPDDEGEAAIHFNGKGTRLGIDVSGPQIPLFCCGNSGGKVEIDFEGNFAIENKPGVLLRHAYWEVKNDDFRFLMGQTWDVISPLNPKCLMYSVYWGAGNIGYRRAQVRYERYLQVTDAWKLDIQTSVNTDAASDFTVGGPSNGDHAEWPVIELRLGSTIGRCRPVSFGVWGHVGEEIFDFNFIDDDLRYGTWSVGADLKVPITDRLGFQGEFFTGTNLKTFLGGVIQGVNIGGTNEAISSTGGWMNVYYDLTPRLHTALGYTVDDPSDADITTTRGRIYNEAVWGNVTYDVTKKFLIGFEVSRWKTEFAGQTPAESTRFEFAGKYAF